MGNIDKLNDLVKEKFRVVEPSYWSFYKKVTFYKKVISGEIRCSDPDGPR
jgi:hypothetical protein